MTFALHSALKIHLADAIPLAVAWGLAIMSLDRWLVVSLVRQPNKWSYLVLAVPRVLLGVLFGLIISTPFTLQIFQPEINQQITKIQQERADAYYAQLAADPLTKKIAADQATVSNDETIIRTNGGAGENPEQDTQIKILQQQLASAEKQAAADYDQWQCQLYGSPGHCHPGNGPLATASHQRYLNDEILINQYNTQVTGQEQQVAANNQAGSAAAVANAKRDLPGAAEKLRTDQAEQAGLAASFNKQNADNAGLLLRLNALDQVAAGSGTLQAARWLLFLFFTAIECLPILVKVLLNLGPENTYEKALAYEDAANLRLSEQETLREQRAALRQSDLLNEESVRAHAGFEKDVLPGLVRDRIAAEERVARARLAAWEVNAMSGPYGGGPGGRLSPAQQTAPRATPFSPDGQFSPNWRFAWRRYLARVLRAAQHAWHKPRWEGPRVGFLARLAIATALCVISFAGFAQALMVTMNIDLGLALAWATLPLTIVAGFSIIWAWDGRKRKETEATEGILASQSAGRAIMNSDGRWFSPVVNLLFSPVVNLLGPIIHVITSSSGQRITLPDYAGHHKAGETVLSGNELVIGNVPGEPEAFQPRLELDRS